MLTRASATEQETEDIRRPSALRKELRGSIVQTVLWNRQEVHGSLQIMPDEERTMQNIFAVLSFRFCPTRKPLQKERRRLCPTSPSRWAVRVHPPATVYFPL